MTLIFTINGTDHGPNGTGALVSFEPQPSGPGKIGQGTAVLLKDGGGYDIRTRQEVQAYEWNGTQITAVYFGGFVAKRDTLVLPGTNTKKWILQLQDYNLLLRRLVGKAAWAQAIRISGTSYPHFAQQVAQMVTALQTGASKSIDATSYVADLVASGMPDQVFVGQSLNTMLTKLCTDAQSLNSALRPRYYLGPDTLVPRATFGGPCLYVYDAASPPVTVMAFSDAPTGAQKTILRDPGYNRSVDSVDQVNWRQGIHQASGAVYTASDATSISTYPNPYDPESAWKEEPLVTTDAIAGTAFQATLTATVANTANPRETLTQSTDAIPPPLPGQYVADSLSLEGLSGGVYQVAASGVTYPGVGTDVVRSQLELGLPKLLYGDESSAGNGVVVETDVIPPDTPAGFTCSSNVFNYTTGLADLTFTWAASTAGDLDPTNSYYLEVRAVGSTIRRITALLTATVSLLPGLAYTATLQAKDTSNNYSAETSLSGTTASGSVPSTVTWPVSWTTANVYDPATNRTSVTVTWDANAGSEGVTAYLVYVTRQGVTTQYTINATDGSHAITLPEERPGVQLTFGVKAHNIVGNSTLLSALKLLTTASGWPVSPTLYNPSAEIGTTDDSTIPDGWTATLGTSATATRSNAVSAPDGYWAFDLYAPSSSASAQLASRAMAVQAGTTYVLRWYAKASAASTSMNLYLDWYDSTGTLLSSSSNYGTAAGTSWAQTGPGSSAVYLGPPPPVAPTNASAVVVRIANPGGAAATHLYLDLIELFPQARTKDLLDSSVTTAKLASGAVTSTELAANSVTNAKLQYGTPVPQTGATGSRPGSPVTGQTYWDTSLKLPIWWNGTTWVDATGASV